MVVGIGVTDVDIRSAGQNIFSLGRARLTHSCTIKNWSVHGRKRVREAKLSLYSNAMGPQLLRLPQPKRSPFTQGQKFQSFERSGKGTRDWDMLMLKKHCSTQWSLFRTMTRMLNVRHFEINLDNICVQTFQTGRTCESLNSWEYAPETQSVNGQITT